MQHTHGFMFSNQTTLDASSRETVTSLNPAHLKHALMMQLLYMELHSVTQEQHLLQRLQKTFYFTETGNGRKKRLTHRKDDITSSHHRQKLKILGSLQIKLEIYHIIIIDAIFVHIYYI